jgi:heme A synthase
MSGINNAEGLLRMRTRVIAVLAVIIMGLQGAVLAATEQITLNGGRTVDQVKVGAFVFMALALMLFILTGGRRARRFPELNDELVRANRASALKLGYASLMLVLIGVYVAMLLTPLDIGKFMPLFIAFGIVVPALRFALLERVGAK